MLLLVLLAMLLLGLERNHRRQSGGREPGAGRTGVPDRDLERLQAELRAVAARQS